MIKHLYIPTNQEKYKVSKHTKISICKSINVKITIIHTIHSLN